jgi:hypothetical protein
MMMTSHKSGGPQFHLGIPPAHIHIANLTPLMTELNSASEARNTYCREVSDTYYRVVPARDGP